MHSHANTIKPTNPVWQRSQSAAETAELAEEPINTIDSRFDNATLWFAHLSRTAIKDPEFALLADKYRIDCAGVNSPSMKQALAKCSA